MFSITALYLQLSSVQNVSLECLHKGHLTNNIEICSDPDFDLDLYQIAQNYKSPQTFLISFHRDSSMILWAIVKDVKEV